MEKMKEKLIISGYKLTKARLAVLAYLRKKHSPISARKMSEDIKGTDRASVYRALNIFEKLGLVNIDIMGMERLYCSAEKPHHHIICTKCGYVETIKCNHKFSHKNFSNIKHQLTVTGLCNKCG